MGVLNAAQGALNTAGTIASAINGLSPKEFYSVADFYNFIKKPDNVPTNHPLVAWLKKSCKHFQTCRPYSLALWTLPPLMTSL